ncbi:hypothetical protein AX17_000660 [Amanita inopinata Kibby_2008]|nr:hypothetical protein AX17_000660 [Amanita inopinata Kibby_2008]
MSDSRPISDTHEQDNLKRFYHLTNADADELKSGPDYARGQVLLESSDEGETKDDLINDGNDSYESDDSSRLDRVITIGGDSQPRKTSEDDDEGLEIDLDENDFADLDAQAYAYSRSHPEQPGQANEEAQRTCRLAAVNLDWDHVRATHLYKICSSLVSPTAPLASTSNQADNRVKKKGSGPAHDVVRGQVQSVRIYPSEFGKERMAREEKEGPPPEIFKQHREDADINEKTVFEIGDGQEYDENSLRKYQLERLRYYYAIITCDTVDAASHIHSELDGTELERSANVFDLSFVPDDMVFDDEYRGKKNRDEATEQNLNSNYKGLEFVTDALRHSKVKLTWDEDDPERNQLTRRTLTRKEIEEADFRAFLASSSESDEDTNVIMRGKHKKGAERDRLRALLLGGNSQMPEGWAKEETLKYGETPDDDVDMEVTFTPGLSEHKDEEHETTLDKYQKRMREKRKKRKDERKERATSKEGDSAKGLRGDEFFAAGSDSEQGQAEADVRERDRTKGGRKKGQGAVGNDDVEHSRAPVTAEELALLVAADNPGDEPKHFNLKSVIKAEKRDKLRKKGRKKKGVEEEHELQEDFVVNVKDQRFNALHEDPQFAIDPSNPRRVSF